MDICYMKTYLSESERTFMKNECMKMFHNASSCYQLSPDIVSRFIKVCMSFGMSSDELKQHYTPRP